MEIESKMRGFIYFNLLQPQASDNFHSQYPYLIIINSDGKICFFEFIDIRDNNERFLKSPVACYEDGLDDQSEKGKDSSEISKNENKEILNQNDQTNNNNINDRNIGPLDNNINPQNNLALNNHSNMNFFSRSEGPRQNNILPNVPNSKISFFNNNLEGNENMNRISDNYTIRITSRSRGAEEGKNPLELKSHPNSLEDKPGSFTRANANEEIQLTWLTNNNNKRLTSQEEITTNDENKQMNNPIRFTPRLNDQQQQEFKPNLNMYNLNNNISTMPITQGNMNFSSSNSQNLPFKLNNTSAPQIYNQHLYNNMNVQNFLPASNPPFMMNTNAPQFYQPLPFFINNDFKSNSNDTQRISRNFSSESLLSVGGNKFNFNRETEFHSVETYELMKKKYCSFDQGNFKESLERSFKRSWQNIKNCIETMNKCRNKMKENQRNLGNN